MIQGKRSVMGLLLALLAVFSFAAAPVTVWAQQAVSPSYSVDEAYFGTGGELDACSVDGNSDGVSYCSRQSAGETAVGNAVSNNGTPNYQVQGGQNTNREEFLSLYVNNTTTDLGVLSVSTPATTTGTFSVSAYLATGYNIITASNPPASGNNVLTHLTSPTASSPGSEQFGINLVANTSPSTFGANVTHSPDSTFGFGVPASGYSAANVYKYVKGDTIASSPKSSGTSNFTISYLYNISTATKSGFYTFNHDLVAVATY